MTDIFREVDEEVRREQFARLWKRYGGWLIAAAVVIVAGVAGWRAYQYWQAQRAAEAGAQFEQALTLSEQDKRGEAEAAFKRLAAEGTAGYRALSRLQEVQELALRDRPAATAAYDALAADSSLSRELRDVAAIRAGMLAVDTADYAAMAGRLEALADKASTFRHTARELLALSAYRSANSEALKRWIEAIVVDPATPQDVRSRIEVLRSVAGLDVKN